MSIFVPISASRRSDDVLDMNKKLGGKKKYNNKFISCSATEED